MPYDAFLLASQLSSRLEGPGARRILRIGAAGACGGALTLYLSGCNLRCVHCWAGEDLERPLSAPMREYAELRGRIESFRRENRLGANPRRVRLSGGEPILSERFFELLEWLLSSPGRIFVETNGVVLGAHPEWTRKLGQLRRRVTLKVSLKAGTKEQFERLTGARSDAFEAGWECIRALRAAGASFSLNALSFAPELFTRSERAALLRKLEQVARGLSSLLEEETLTAYPGTARRMRTHLDRARRGQQIAAIRGSSAQNDSGQNDASKPARLSARATSPRLGQ
ncbi:MAG: radical SAM protein [Myxococcales bacterium]|nr:radical SAM protein [Myxococcales bacterium]